MSGFVKYYSDKAAPIEALRRSSSLRTAGVPTPAVLGPSGENGLCFEHVEGQSGQVLLAKDLARLLSVVARLHRASLPNLPAFDPFLRIRPRAGVETALPVVDILSEPVPTGHATLHGDLHVGQFLQSRSGDVWIVDLDDLAVGPPEADLANFAAHLATSQPSCRIHDWSDRVCKAWAAIGDSVDHDVLTRFLRFALVRRHLKLREAGRPDFEAEILGYLRESSNFSIL